VLSIEFYASAILAILLIVLDKMGKLNPQVLTILFLIAAGLAIHPAISNPWVKAAPSIAWRCWRTGFILSIAALAFSALGIWLFSEKQSTQSELVVDNRSLQPKSSTIEDKSGMQEPAKQVNKKSQNVAMKSGHVIQQQGQNNIAQIGNNNQATITTAVPRRLSSEQKEKLILLLSPYKDIPFDGIYTLGQDGEAGTYAQDFFQVFKAAGWNVGVMVGLDFGMTIDDPNNPIPSGVWIVVSRGEAKSPPEGANIIANAFRSVGIEPKGMTSDIPSGKIQVLVGTSDAKPIRTSN